MPVQTPNIVEQSTFLPLAIIQLLNLISDNGLNTPKTGIWLHLASWPI